MKKIAAILMFCLAIATIGPSANASTLTLSTATTSADGATIVLSFQNPASGISWSVRRPAAADFVISGSTQGAIPATLVSTMGIGVLQITMSQRIRPNQSLKLSYVPGTTVPISDSGEPLAAFTDVPVTNRVSSAVPIFTGAAYSSNLAGPSVVLGFNDTELDAPVPVICNATVANFELKVNGTARAISSVNRLNTVSCSGYRIYFTPDVVANDQAFVKFTSSTGVLTNDFGGQVASTGWIPVGGIADTIPPTINVASSHKFTKGTASSIALAASEEVSWSIVQDSTLQFRISDDQRSLIVSSVLPAGSYTVDLRAYDGLANQTTKSILIQIVEGLPTPSPTPTVTASPTQTPAPTAVPAPKKVPVYKNCAALNKSFPSGIAKSYLSKNKGKALKLIPLISALYYNANLKLDVDKDGIVCEK